MNFIGGKLKLKNLKNEKSSNLIGKIGIKDIKPENKIEKKDEKITKNDEEYLNQLIKNIENPSAEPKEEILDDRTEAQKLFEERRSKRIPEKVQQKLSANFRQRTEVFKKSLSKLPQHFDIPKVGPG